MVGSLGDDFALFVLLIFLAFGAGALAALLSVVVVVVAAVQRTAASIGRAFVAGTFLLPIAGLLGGLGLDAGTSDSSAPLFFVAAVVAGLGAVGGILVSGRIAVEHERRAPFDETRGLAGLGLAALLAAVALVGLGF